jgi:hypothetical protein
MIRAFGIRWARASGQKNLLVAWVQVLSGCPFRPWTSTILLAINTHEASHRRPQRRTQSVFRVLPRGQRSLPEICLQPRRTHGLYQPFDVYQLIWGPVDSWFCWIQIREEHGPYHRHSSRSRHCFGPLNSPLRERDLDTQREGEGEGEGWNLRAQMLAGSESRWPVHYYWICCGFEAQSTLESCSAGKGIECDGFITDSKSAPQLLQKSLQPWRESEADRMIRIPFFDTILAKILTWPLHVHQIIL